ncbi:MAG TPA: hypothetical protein VM554_12850 [Acidisarcina sp.]|nr:hypothetical protein [Acidisarcina sp.]
MKIFPTLPGLTLPVLRTVQFDTLVQAAPNKYEVRLPQTVNPQWSWELVYDFLRDWPAGSFTVSELRTLEDFFLYHGGQAADFLFLDPDDNSVGPAMLAGAPNTPLAQLQLVNDGVGNYYSPVQRTLGGLFYEDVTDLNGALTVYCNGVLQSSSSYTVQGPGLALPGASYMGLVIKWPSPPGWSAGAARALGYQILDPAGHLQKVTTAGTTGSTAPSWNDAGGTTTDGTVTWTDQGYNPGPAAPVTAQFNFYFRVRFASDAQDMEKFSNQFWTIGGSAAGKGSGKIRLQQSRPSAL